MARKSKVLERFENMERCMRRIRQPVYKGLNFTLERCDNVLYLTFIQSGEGMVAIEIYTEGRSLKCLRAYDDLQPWQAKVSQRVYKFVEKFHNIYREFGGKA